MNARTGQGRRRLNYNYQENKYLLDNEEDDLTPEQRLFSAIIEIHMIDALGRGIALTKKTRKLEQQRATSWLLYSKEFMEYCRYLGIDASTMRDRVRKHIKSAVQ